MGLEDAMRVSVSGIEAQRLTMELIASNIANINTTRTVYGGPYRRLIAVLGDKPISFSEELTREQEKISGGVEVVEIVEDRTPFPKVYNPGHPDADSEGFVSLPNVDLAKEMVNQMFVSRLYEANITTYNASKRMMQDTLQLP